jgi:hydrogenase expression/formation protein HypC
MCVTVPCKVLQVKDGQAEVLFEGKSRWVRVPDIPDLAEGEYVTVYAGTALARMSAADAEETLRLFDELAAMEDAAND